MTMNVRLIGVLLVLAAMTATQASAGQGWEIEAHGGVLASTNPTNGTATLPPIGPDIPLFGSGNTSSTRQVPSWYFGDGAAILNGILGTFSPMRIVPLDPVLGSRIVDRQAGASLGVRVDRALSPRFAVEVSLDAALGTLALRSASKQMATASALSFPPVWNTLLTPTGTVQAVTSNAAFEDQRGRQLITTGSLLINLLSGSTFTPYVAVGAGLIAAGSGPSVTLVGNYSFLFPPGNPSAHINETDTVTVQAEAGNTATFVFGGGVKYALGDRWGVRADLRDYVNHDVVRTVVTAKPTSASSGAPFVLTFPFSLTSPLVIFSNSPSSLSTLSTPLNDVQTFKGSGIVNQINATAGIYWRF